MGTKTYEKSPNPGVPREFDLILAETPNFGLFSTKNPKFGQFWTLRGGVPPPQGPKKPVFDPLPNLTRPYMGKVPSKARF